MNAVTMDLSRKYAMMFSFAGLNTTLDTGTIPWITRTLLDLPSSHTTLRSDLELMDQL